MSHRENIHHLLLLQRDSGSTEVWMESENFSQRRYWKECVCAAVDSTCRHNNNSSTCETCLMSELSPRLQPVTASFDNSLRRRGELPGMPVSPLWGVHSNREQAEHTVIQLISCARGSIHLSLCFQSVFLSFPVCHSQSLSHYVCHPFSSNAFIFSLIKSLFVFVFSTVQTTQLTDLFLHTLLQQFF